MRVFCVTFLCGLFILLICLELFLVKFDEKPLPDFQATIINRKAMQNRFLKKYHIFSFFPHTLRRLLVDVICVWRVWRPLWYMAAVIVITRNNYSHIVCIPVKHITSTRR